MLLSDEIKLGIGVISQNLNGAATTPYYAAANYKKTLVLVELGAMAVGKTCVIQALQATDAAGTGSEAITHLAATVTANTNVLEAVLTSAATAPADTCVVNGVTLTGAAAADLPNKKFLADAADDDATVASLAACINANVPGVVATASAANDTVTIVPKDPEQGTVTVVGTAVRLVASTTKALGFVEIDNDFLKEGFTHVAASVTTDAAIQTAAVVLRGRPRYYPIQNGIPSKTDTQA